MNFKKLLPVFLLIFTTLTSAQDTQTTKVKLYGYVANDFFYNSRQNKDLVDGVIELYPLPVELSNGTDKNAVPQAEMLSVNTRLGLDISGTQVFGAKSSGKIEADFAGFGTSFYVLRIRQAYVRLNWEKTELTLGQTWHPLFGSVSPTTIASNGGAPFQPFNRSPQLRIKQDLNSTISFTAAASYQMQYASQGPLGTSNVYMKNSMIPDIYAGFETKTSHWITGIGADIKTIKPDTKQITSVTGEIHAQYTKDKFQLKAKAVYGENLSDHLMLGGYGVSKYAADSTTVLSYTNLNTFSSWINAVYGTKVQLSVLLGMSQNLGSNELLSERKGGKYTLYGYGYFDATQQLLDKLYRFSPQLSYNLSNLKIGLQYDLTSAGYGTVENTGKVTDPVIATNHRVLATVCYIF